jgi:probable phosphoglycerate mutase
MTITLLTLIRHGFTDWNQTKRAQGLAPIPLNAQGLAQARHLADAMANGEAIHAVYSSDLSRCVQTAAPVAAAFGLEVRLDPAFREYDLGFWQGLSGQEMQDYDPEHYARRKADPWHVPFPGGESRAMLSARVVAGLDAVLARHPGQHVVVVTHSGPVHAVLRHLGVWPPSQDGPAVLNTSRSVVRVDLDGRAEAVLIADISHLPADLVS